MSPEDWSLVKSFSEERETPFLVVNLNIIKKRYQELINSFPYAKVHYAVKANPADEVLLLLKELGSNFDVASVYELRKLLRLGVDPSRISYGNTIKKAADIREHYEAGVRLYVTDSEADLRNIAKAAPNSKIFVRILTEGMETADWPLSRKFGCQTDMAADLIVLAKKLGLEPYGISFHVGSQQRDISAWDAAISKVRYIFSWLEDEEDIKLKMINMGGGFPANYVSRTNELSVYAEEITRYLIEDFGDDHPEIILEPGRSLVADSGVIVSEVVLVSRKSRTSLNRWVYTDVGKFNGLIETLEESIKFPIFTDRRGEVEECIIAGPTCDSQDIMYEDHKYELPLTLTIGDRLYWFSTGAYTTSYCSVEFNGFPPLKSYFIQ
ncbi:MAG: type III PLP-dependent enzyme [Candidatus Cloacimonetes bacterium]|nr:type III PLP-dependent enzyme [Candidatus Cloacimonadota bacterium]